MSRYSRFHIDVDPLKLPVEKDNIQKNWYSRILYNSSGHLFTPCGMYVDLNISVKGKQILLSLECSDSSVFTYS